MRGDNQSRRRKRISKQWGESKQIVCSNMQKSRGHHSKSIDKPHGRQICPVFIHLREFNKLIRQDKVEQRLAEAEQGMAEGIIKGWIMDTPAQ